MAVEKFYREYRYPPTRRELAVKLRKSPTTIQASLEILIRKGFLTTQTGKVRSVMGTQKFSDHRDLVAKIAGDIVAPTPTELRVLMAIHEYVLKFSYGPSHEDLAVAIGVSTESPTIQNHLNSLQGKGWIRFSPRHPRSVRLDPAFWTLLKGKSPAGPGAAGDTGSAGVGVPNPTIPGDVGTVGQ